MTDQVDELCGKIAAAIGGRDRAGEFERRFRSLKRKTLQSWIDGVTSPQVADLRELARLTGRDLAWFLDLDAPGPAPSLVSLATTDAVAAAGAGAHGDVVRETGIVGLPRAWVERFAGPGAKLSCLRAKGDSMAPTIRDGALLVIDETQRRPRPWVRPPAKGPRRPQRRDDAFVFWHADDLRLKRLRDVGDGYFAVLSDNVDEHPPEIVKPGRDGAFVIVGKVVWWAHDA